MRLFAMEIQMVNTPQKMPPWLIPLIFVAAFALAAIPAAKFWPDESQYRGELMRNVFGVPKAQP